MILLARKHLPPTNNLLPVFQTGTRELKDGAVYRKKFTRQMLSMYILKCAGIEISTYNNSDVTVSQLRSQLISDGDLMEFKIIRNSYSSL